ncbi:MAG TPA: hypothetical protein VGF79_02340, partial [Bacteroidia bacterium]
HFKFMKHLMSILFTLMLMNVCLASDSTGHLKLTHIHKLARKHFTFKENSTLKIKTKSSKVYRGKMKIINDSQITISKYIENVLSIDTLHEDSIYKVAMLTVYNKVGGSALIAGGTGMIIAGFASFSNPNFLESIILAAIVGDGLVLDLIGSLMVINRYRKGEFRIIRYFNYY